MKLTEKNVIVTRPYKTVYKDQDRIVKVFSREHGKENVFNEALCHARVETSGLNIPEILEVGQIGDRWALAVKYVEGKTLKELMEEHPDKEEEYMNKFVDLQIEMHSKKVPLLNFQKEKLARKIGTLKDMIDATTRYELCTRLESVPSHTKLCHGDFTPENIIVSEDGTMTIVVWAHATQGNAGGDAASTYLKFALQDQMKADLYLDLYCKKSDTAMQYVQKWMPVAAAEQLAGNHPEEKEFLMRWIDIIDFQ